MDVLQLHQRIAGGMGRQIHTGIVLLQLFIAALGGSQRVVAVAHGEDNGLALQAFVLLANICRVLSQSCVELFDLFLRNQPAGDMAAVFHQVAVVQHLEAVLLGGDGLDQNLLVVIAQQQDVGQLDGSIAADTLTGRNTLGDGALGSADGGGGAHGVIVSIQIHHAHQTHTDGAVLQGALHIDQAVLIGLEDAVLHVLSHGLVDQSGVSGFLLGAQLGFGQDQVDGGNAALSVGTDAVPILLIGGELVTGDDGPLGKVGVLGQQNISRQENILVHRNLLLSYRFQREKGGRAARSAAIRGFRMRSQR